MLTLKLFWMEIRDWARVYSQLKVKAFVYDLSEVLLTHAGFLKDYTSLLEVWLTRVNIQPSHMVTNQNWIWIGSESDNCHEQLFPPANIAIHIGTHYSGFEWKMQRLNTAHSVQLTQTNANDKSRTSRWLVLIRRPAVNWSKRPDFTDNWSVKKIILNI